MKNQQKIKKLAQIAAEKTNVPNDIEEYVLKCLNKQELKKFLRYFKFAVDKKRIYVSSPSDLSVESLKLIKNRYNDKELVINIDKNLGAGLRIHENDMIVDFTFEKYINDTIEKLKN